MEYYLDEEVLHTKLFDRTIPRCLGNEESEKALWEVYERICTTYENKHMMARKIRRLGYF
jgi:hypothetical protein